MDEEFLDICPVLVRVVSVDEQCAVSTAKVLISLMEPDGIDLGSAATRQLADNTQMRKAKKRIARLKTLIHERTIIAAHDRLVATAVADGE